MYCKQCGTEIDGKFCKECGTAVESITPNQKNPSINGIINEIIDYIKDDYMGIGFILLSIIGLIVLFHLFDVVLSLL